MEGEAADFILQVDGDQLAVLDHRGFLNELEAALLQMPLGAGHAVGADGDVAVLAAAHLLHDLEAHAGEVGGIALLHGPAHQRGDLLRHIQGLLGVLGVDAHMAQLEAQHLVHGGAGGGGDAIPVLGGNGVLGAHPGTAAAQDLVEGQVVQHVLLVDAAGGHELHVGINGGHGLDQVQAAHSLGGEELDSLQAAADGDLHVRGVGRAGAHRDALGHAIFHDLRRKAGGNDGGRARVHGAIHLLGGQHGAGAQQHVGQLLVHAADGLLRGGGTEGDLGHGQAAVRQGLAQRHSVIRIVDGDDGHQTGQGQFLQKFHDRSSFLFRWYLD